MVVFGMVLHEAPGVNIKQGGCGGLSSGLTSLAPWGVGQISSTPALGTSMRNTDRHLPNWVRCSFQKLTLIQKSSLWASCKSDK